MVGDWKDRNWLRIGEMGILIIFVISGLAWAIAQASVPQAAAQPGAALPGPDPDLQVYAYAMPNQGWAPLTVYFSTFGSQDPDGDIVRYQWDLDGNGSFESDTTEAGGYASYIYSKPGEYTITVKVTNTDGGSATAATEINVRHPASSSVDYWTVFDDSRVRRVEIQLTQADWELMWVDPISKHQVKADAVIFGERLNDIGFRMRGQFSLRESGAKKPWKIDTDAYVEGQEFHNLKQLVFTNNIGDPTMLREKIAYDLMAFAGVPASHVSFVEFWIDFTDDEEPPIFWGVYTLIERVDKKFLANRFGPDSKDGNLYKASHAQRGPMDLIYYGDSILDYPTVNGNHAYGKATNEEAADYDDILHLIYAIDGVSYGSPEEFARALENVFNVDAFLRYMAVMNTFGSWDFYPYTGNNYYLFNNSAAGKMEWIPWDLGWGGDLTQPLFGRVGPGLVERAPLYDRVFEVERYRRTYAAYLDLIVRFWFTGDQISSWTEEYHALIAPYVTQSTGDKMYFGETALFPIEVFENGWRELGDYARERGQFILEAIR